MRFKQNKTCQSCDCYDNEIIRLWKIKKLKSYGTSIASSDVSVNGKLLMNLIPQFYTSIFSIGAIIYIYVITSLAVCLFSAAVLNEYVNLKIVQLLRSLCSCYSAIPEHETAQVNDRLSLLAFSLILKIIFQIRKTRYY